MRVERPNIVLSSNPITKKKKEFYKKLKIMENYLLVRITISSPVSWFFMSVVFTLFPHVFFPVCSFISICMRRMVRGQPEVEKG